MVLDFYSRKQQHVVRSTFAAELHALLDASSQAVLLAVTLTEVLRGGAPAAELLRWQRIGDFAVPVDVVIDAKAVFDALNAEVVKTPAERHLLLPLLAAKELIDRRILDRLYWIDIRSMLADGLTKGCIDRSALMRSGRQGLWLLDGEAPVPTKAVPVKAHTDDTAATGQP